jgi:HK97 family phage prohead protease
MNNLTFERFLPITKIDRDTQMIYGYASTPDLDDDGEIISVKALEKALPDYLKFPTIREMHQPKAIGATKQTRVDKSGLYIGAKIVNRDAWELVKEGVYKAFSIGGNIVKKVNNVIEELSLVEISLVDVPANKHAVIEVWKQGKPNIISEATRKGVLESMKKQDDIEIKDEDRKREEEEEVIEEKEDKEIEEEVTPEVIEEKEEGDDKEDEEVKEAMADLETADAILSKLETKKEKTIEVTKAITNIAGTIATMASHIEKMQERITALEKLPAPTKSKAVYVYKGEDSDGEKKEGSSELDAIDARLAELNKIFATIGANRFAKEGFSTEASKLQEKKRLLEVSK